MSRGYLIREAQLDGTIIEYEVYGIEDPRLAATVVFEDIDSTAVHMRERFDRHTGAEIAFDPDKYDRVIEIVAGKVTSLPTRVPAFGPLENDFDRAALSASQVYADRVGGPSDIAVAVEGFMRGLVDLSCETEGVDLAEVVGEVSRDRGDDGRDDSPRLLIPLLKQLDFQLGGNAAATTEALEHFVEHSGVEGAEDPAVAYYHMIYSLIEVAEKNGIDFTHLMAQVLENEPAAEQKPAI